MRKAREAGTLVEKGGLAFLEKRGGWFSLKKKGRLSLLEKRERRRRYYKWAVRLFNRAAFFAFGQIVVDVKKMLYFLFFCVINS